MAQQGYGLSNAVGGFFDTYFKVKEMRMKEDQFNRNMAEEQRQFSLLQAYDYAQLMSKQPTTEYQNFSQEGYYKVEPGKEPTYIQNQNKPMGGDSFENFTEKGYWDTSKGKPQYIPNPNYKERPSEISLLNQQLKLEKIEEGRTQKQDLYDSIMDSWDDKLKAYTLTDSKGNEIIFENDKALERYAKEQVIKTKLPGRVNFWSRKGQKVDVKGKHKSAYNTLIKKGYSEQEAIDLIKKNEGIK